MTDVGPGEGGLDHRSRQAADVDDGRVRRGPGVVVDDDGAVFEKLAFQVPRE